jgi:hypothetical protein
MKKTPGASPGSSASPGAGSGAGARDGGRAWSRPWLALGIAALGLVVAVFSYPLYSATGVGAAIGSAPGWLRALVDLAVATLPLLVAVLIAGWVASTGGAGRATGIRSWRFLDVFAGISVALVARSIVELISPTTATLDGGLGVVDVCAVTVALLGFALVSPLMEELFFRGLVQRALGDALARAGAVLAGTVSVLVSTCIFIGAHLAAEVTVPVVSVVAWVLVGLGCGILTLLTGRLGGAIAAHVVFNGIGVALIVW